ncbi:hypothetical protein SEVIR_4G147501v4 [Setaria viridis]|uniref:Uncharacterized protein n=1 Tax=Setaria viridis TaxID=4556 RepID=A0A4U6V1I3_SETVI|nr:hypothetical protein SEVIR_4G147501v2 [Setaria viridis]TKW21843.1 hypothetical protein SEVIR_4G147501v2 [Setaria viridis]TKW21845.1 hypothetical protein SEVIR_4G147501v2 [Setaria viridis]TKW21846.1 hypothetical protein SEVIR_4G147501v2 [Setaria viridis]
MEMAERWLLAPKKASIWLREFYFSWRVRIHPLLCVQEKKENYSPWRARPRWATKIWICCCCGYTSKSGQCFQEFYSLSLLLEKKFDARISCSIDDTFCVRDQPSSITNRN